jgi:hypothetical protein
MLHNILLNFFLIFYFIIVDTIVRFCQAVFKAIGVMAFIAFTGRLFDQFNFFNTFSSLTNHY